jgi:hypothetical protein
MTRIKRLAKLDGSGSITTRLENKARKPDRRVNMLKSIQAKFANFVESFYASGSGLLKSAPFISWRRKYLPKPLTLFGIELLVAISLAVYYFFLMLPQMDAPRQIDGNEMNPYLFTYLSDHPYSQKDIASDFTSWKPRLAGPMISGLVYDLALGNHAKTGDHKSSNHGWVVLGTYRFGMETVIFSSYQAIWLFLLFMILILHRKDALLIMLGVFSGLMYNLSVPAGQWFYPWDMPTMLFFTWACLLYDKRQLFPLMVVVWLGSLFKETTLVCTLLILLSEHWTLKKRIAGFAVTVIVCLLTRKLLMAAYGVNTMLFALNHTTNFHDLILKPWSVLVCNLNYLCSFNLNHALFINAGALFIMMLLPWRTRRDVVLKILALAFIICAFLFGGYSVFAEFRDWYELLPLGWMMISENLSNRFPTVSGGQAESGLLQPDLAVDRTSRVMKGSYWLTMGVLLVIAAGVLIVGNLIPPQLDNGNKSNLLAWQKDRDSKKEVMDNAIALNNLAWSLATSSDASIRNGALAVEMATRACEQTHYQQTMMIGTLAAAYAEAGRFDEAMSTGQKACALASEHGDTDLLKRNQELVTLYQAHQPYHEPPPNSDGSPPH